MTNVDADVGLDLGQSTDKSAESVIDLADGREVKDILDGQRRDKFLGNIQHTVIKYENIEIAYDKKLDDNANDGSNIDRNIDANKTSEVNLNV